MGLSVLIIEDEFIIAEDIKEALLTSGYKVFGTALTYEDALDLLKKGKPDFALVDITLQNDQSGLELGRILCEDLQIPYIYVTSHSDISTLEKVKLTNPSGYLLKPFRRESIYTAIEVALVNFNHISQLHPENELTIMLKKGEEKTKIKYSEILFLESDGNYTNLQTVNARYTERKALKDLLEEMNEHPFIRVHKSYAVNKNKIHHFTREKIFIAGHEVPIGRTYAEELVKYLS
jgi:two-component system, LytTR family, response regulator LytT